MDQYQAYSTAKSFGSGRNYLVGALETEDAFAFVFHHEKLPDDAFLLGSAVDFVFKTTGQCMPGVSEAQCVMAGVFDKAKHIYYTDEILSKYEPGFLQRILSWAKYIPYTDDNFERYIGKWR